MANTWGRSGTTWSQGLWGQQDNNAAALTGVSATISLGSIVSYPEQGWGRDAYGEEPYGDSYDPNIIISTGFGLTSSLGSTTVSTEINVGWGSDTWGSENWGQSGLTVELTAPDGLTASLPAVGWGNQTWGADKWGGEYCLDPADVMGLTGIGATASVGSPTAISDFTGTLSGQSATSSVGAIAPTEMTIGLSTAGVGTTGVGAIAPADVMGLTGVSATTSIGSITVASVELINVTGVGATASVGAITPTEMAVGLSGVSATASTGSIAPTEMTIGLTGLSATVTVGQVGGPIAWKKVTPTQGGSWSKKTATQGGSWSKVTPP